MNWFYLLQFGALETNQLFNYSIKNEKLESQKKAEFFNSVTTGLQGGTSKINCTTFFSEFTVNFFCLLIKEIVTPYKLKPMRVCIFDNKFIKIHYIWSFIRYDSLLIYLLVFKTDHSNEKKDEEWTIVELKCKLKPCIYSVIIILAKKSTNKDIDKIKILILNVPYL